MDGSPTGPTLLVDGHNLLYASFFGMPDRIRAPDGRPVHGTYGFLASLLAMIRGFAPAAVVVCFDSEQPNYRHGMSSAYKANRAPVDPERNPFSQYGDIRRGLDLLGIRWWEHDGVEADDLIGSIAAAVARTSRVVICSMDQDMLQLVGQNVRVFAWGRGAAREYDAAAVLARYGVRPDQFVDYRALVGDASDNIAGVRGVGARTAQKLLSAFGSIEGIYEAKDALSPRLSRALEASRAGVELSRALLRIRRDVPVEPRLVESWRGSGRWRDAVSARDVMRELGLWRQGAGST